MGDGHQLECSQWACPEHDAAAIGVWIRERLDLSRGPRVSASHRAIELGMVVADVEASQVWVATTDADSVVGPDWLARHAEYATRGLDGVAGLVDLPRTRIGEWCTVTGRSWRREEPPPGMATSTAPTSACERVDSSRSAAFRRSQSARSAWSGMH